jgi:hypothetical protein
MGKKLKTIEKGRGFMLKKTRFLSIPILILTILIIFSTAYAEEKGYKKTITLPSGEVVCDLSGQWNYEFNGRGELRTSGWSGGTITDAIEITQEGGSFKGVRLKGNQFGEKGQLAVEGEMDKNGIKKMYHQLYGRTNGSFKTELSKDGNKIEINDPNFIVELIRK